MLNVLSSIRVELGSLDRIVAFLRVLVHVNSAPGFTQHPSVADGASRPLGRVFGPEGAHARCAVGMSSLPMNISTGIEAIVEIR